MKLLSATLCVLSVASASIAGAGNLPDAPCAKKRISASYATDLPSSLIVYPGSNFNFEAQGDSVMWLSRALRPQLASMSVCTRVRESSPQPTRLVRVTVARGVVAWKAVAIEAK